MKYFIKWIAFFTVITIVIPLVLHRFVTKSRSDDNPSYEARFIKLYKAKEGKVITIDSEEYVLGALMAEMPAEFEVEALKAQSVAIRTYLYDKLDSANKIQEHKGAVICDDSTHCQAYSSYDDMKKKWNKNASLYYKKCKKAVLDTLGEVAFYKGEPINAVFHAYSHGKTENAEDVWGTKVEYLISVDSPGDLELPKLKSEVEISIVDFKDIMQKEYGCVFEGELMGDVSFTQGGAVDTLFIGNKHIRGTDIRKTFGLKSASFSLQVLGDVVKFNVKGYGHGVGMSQYGANYYAKQGLKYDVILKKYYTGITIDKV